MFFNVGSDGGKMMPPRGLSAARKSTDDGNKGISMDSTTAREKLSRAIISWIRVRNGHGALVSEEPVMDATLLLVNRHFPPVPSSVSWNFRRPLRSTPIDAFPRGFASLFHFGDQRLFMKHVLLGDLKRNARMLLDLSHSPGRDRLLLHNGMEIIVRSRLTPATVLYSIKVETSKDPEISWIWDNKYMESDFLTRVQGGSHVEILSFTSEEVVTESSQMTSEEPVLTDVADPKAARRKTGVRSLDEGAKPKKSITWGTAVNIESGEHMEMDKMEEEEATASGNVTQAGLDGPLQTPPLRLALTVNSRPFVVLDEKNPSVYLAGRDVRVPSSCGVVLPLDFADRNSVVGVITLDSIHGHLVLPRIHRSQDVDVQLVIPHDVDFALVDGDVLILEKDAVKVTELKVDIPRISRSPPTDTKNIAKSINPSHLIQDIGIEATYQQRKKRWNGAVELVSSHTKPITFLFPKKHFQSKPVTIGRSNCDICVADPHLSKHHVTIVREQNQFYVMRPEGDRKPVYLLLGKRDLHYRPPMPLRSGDVITIGRSDLKVIYQQRGNRAMSCSSALEELLLRTPSISRPSCELHLKDALPSATTQQQNGDVEMSGNSSSSSSTADSAPPPVFGDLNSLLAHFHSPVDPSGPLMVLMCTRGPRRGAFFLCRATETTFGSGFAADVSIPNDRRLSDIHARVYFDTNQQRWVLEDLQSRHGTFLKIEGSGESLMLSIGDVLVMGLTNIRILGQYPKESKGCIQQ